MSRGELGKEISYEYNADGQQKKIVYPSGRKTLYSYDDNGNMLTSIIDGVGIIAYTYDERNSKTSSTLPNGVTESFVHDSLGQTTSINIANAIGSLHKVTRDYSANSNVKSSSIGSVNPITETYSHDALNRNTGTSSTIAGADGLNEYNDANHIIKTMGETVVSDKTGKPMSVGTKTLSYDALGNRTQEANNQTLINSTLEWTVDGKLSKFGNTAQDKDIAYGYASNGLLSQKTSTILGQETTKLITWNENSSNALMISDGEFEYVYGSSRIPLAQVNIENNEVQYLHADFVGSVIAITDDASNVESILNYGAYGKRIGANVSRFGFAGEWIDEATGYSYNRARWYDSSTANFLSKDPFVQSTQEAYGYAGGNPLTRVDSSGAAWCWEDAHSFMASECFEFMDSEWAQVVTDFSAGNGDVISLGLTNQVRESMGTNNVVNSCSTAYKVGEVTGEVTTSLDPKKQVAKAAVKQIAKKSDNIPQGITPKRVIQTQAGKSFTIGNVGGSYGGIMKDLGGSLSKNNAEVNHIPSNLWNGKNTNLNRNQGGAILMHKPDHRATRTCGYNNRIICADENGLSFKEVFDRDIKQIRDDYGTKYDNAIEELTNYYKGIGKL